MGLRSRVHYYQRVLAAYLLPGRSHLTFWHDLPQPNRNASPARLGEYYMPFREKADYAGPCDPAGIPLLNYRGHIGLQYNPIAIAQWGLGNYNLFCATGDLRRKEKFEAASLWLRNHLEQSPAGLWVWNHHFDWEYRTRLKAPWYSGLAQGQGISLLVRAYQETRDQSYLEAAQRAFRAFLHSTEKGGVTWQADDGDLWFEEYLVSPPTHILNGFIWAAWGVRDYFLAIGDPAAGELFHRAVRSLTHNLHHYDLGFWSLYERSGTRLPMIASRFYHRLHVVQLQVMHRLTGEQAFAHYADKWDSYQRRRANRTQALLWKGAFKLCYY